VAKIIKRGIPKVPQQIVQQVFANMKEGVLDISDDEFEMTNGTVLGRRQIADRPLSDEATNESKRARID
jgi:hypothetical protein